MRQPVRCVRPAIRLLFLGLFLSPAFAETAVLECVSYSVRPEPPRGEARTVLLHPGVSLEFNTASVKEWRIAKATLLIHVAAGRPSAKLRLRSGDRKPVRIQQVSVQPEGWVHVEIRGDYSLSPLELIGGKGTSIHTHESIHFAPYLIVEGSPR